MYIDALSFLEDERDAFRPFEALADLPDAALVAPVAAAGGWSAVDLMGHLLLWLETGLEVARELAIGDRSATETRLEEELAVPGALDRRNDEGLARYRSLPPAQVCARFRDAAGELRGYLTVVPEIRWIKDADRQRFFVEDTIEHYEEHLDALEAILAAARPAA